MLLDRCLSVCLSICPVLSCLSVTLVYRGQTVGLIQMKLGMLVGLGPSHTVLDEGGPSLQVSLPQRGTTPPPNLWPISVGSMDEDATC